MCYRVLRRLWGVVDDVDYSTVCIEHSVHGHVDVLDCAVDPEDFGDVWDRDVLCEFFNHNLRTLATRQPQWSGRTQASTIASPSTLGASCTSTTIIGTPTPRITPGPTPTTTQTPRITSSSSIASTIPGTTTITSCIRSIATTSGACSITRSWAARSRSGV